MMATLKQETVEQHLEKIKTLKERHKEMVKEDGEHTKRQNKMSQEDAEAKELILKHEQESHNLNHKRQLLQRESQLNHRQTIELEELLAADKFEKELQEETAKQLGFFEALPTILETAIKDCFEGLEGFKADVDVNVAVKEIKAFLEAVGWNQEVSNANAYKAKYDEVVRGLCEKKLKGQKITARELQRRNLILREFSMLPAIERFWNKL